MLAELLTVEEALTHVEYAIEHTTDRCSFVIRDNWPFRTDFTLTKCTQYVNYNIDWDTRETIGDKILAMGSLDFDTLEQGARELARQINLDVKPFYWDD